LAGYAHCEPSHKLYIFVHSKHPFLLVSLGDHIRGRVGAAAAALESATVADNLAFVEIVVALVVAVEGVHIQVRVGEAVTFFFVGDVQRRCV